ncbi:hypothetical protein [Streptomyces sp. NPDC101393]|uniref:hypothetical protein n=1 Tax=Streptomyces sp. NPDC101393 TaxID=3366141 RepID=UPI00381CF6A9
MSIRLITSRRLAALEHDRDHARMRAREVQEASDRAFAGHTRSAQRLTAGRETAQARADALQWALDIAKVELAEAHERASKQAARIEELSAPVKDVPALLLHYGKPHSIHPDQASALAHAVALGASPSRWVPPGERLAAELRWLCVPFIYRPDGDYFLSVAAPAVGPLEGAA